MELRCLGQAPHAPCLLLSLGALTVLLDCALDLPSLAHPGQAGPCHISVQLPAFDMVPAESIDVVLITNHINMLALPFLCRRPGFRARIYATTPTAQLALLHMEELAGLAAQVAGEVVAADGTAGERKKSVEAAPSSPGHCLYTVDEVKRCVAGVQGVSYGEPVDLLTQGWRAVAVSSGFCLGGCNWVLEGPLRLVYLGTSSSTTMRHPCTIDATSLAPCDVLIAADANVRTVRSSAAAMTEAVRVVQTTLAGGGDVVIPSFPSGLLLDIIDFLRVKLPVLNVYCISPVVEQCLAHANVAMEWLSRPKQDKVYLPTEPFAHQELARRGQLHVFPSVAAPEFGCTYLANKGTPSIFFVSHPSLQAGDVTHFLRGWPLRPQDAVLCVEPDFPPPRAAQFPGLRAAVHHCPVDLRLSAAALAKVLRDCRPALFLCGPDVAAALPTGLPVTPTVVGPDAPVVLPDFCPVVGPGRYEAARLHPALLDRPPPAGDPPCRPLVCDLHSLDGRHVLRAAPAPKRPRREAEEAVAVVGGRPVLCGSVSAQQVLRSLQARGVPLVEASDDGAGGRVHVESAGGVGDVRWVDGEAHATVVESDDPVVRALLTHAVLEHLTCL